MNFFQLWKLKFGNINFPSLLLRVSFQHTFLFQSLLHVILSILPTSILRQHRLLSVSCHRWSSTRVNTVKFTWCPVGMWICENIRSSHFFILFFNIFSEKHENAGCCWVVAVDHYFVFKSSFLYKVKLRRWAPCEMAVVIWDILL